MRNFALKYYATHTKFCIVGGGTAGLNISSHLAKHYDPKSIRIFEPSKLHYYQPGFTMIGGNLVQGKDMVSQNWRLYNKNIHWTQSGVKLIDPQKNQITTQTGQEFTYEQLVVVTGIKFDWHKIVGAKQALEDPNSPVVSIYTYDTAQKTRRFGKNFTGGTAVFTQPDGPIKCGGAPQKILYLLTKEWLDKGINLNSHFYKVGQTMFGVKKYSVVLDQVAKGYGIHTHFQSRLIQVNKQTRQAIFLNLKNNEKQVKSFDFLHLVPPMSPHSYIKESGLGNDAGYVNVNKHTLQHVKYPNVWSLGDCSSLPSSKTAAAIFAQSQVVIKNLIHTLKNEPLSQEYNGYSCCPIFVGGNKLMLAQFIYDMVPTQTAQKLHFHKPTRPYYWMKKYFFPYAYWNILPKGLWGGSKGISTDW